MVQDQVVAAFDSRDRARLRFALATLAHHHAVESDKEHAADDLMHAEADYLIAHDDAMDALARFSSLRVVAEDGR
jgi:hypothetical protein